MRRSDTASVRACGLRPWRPEVVLGPVSMWANTSRSTGPRKFLTSIRRPRPQAYRLVLVASGTARASRGGRDRSLGAFEFHTFDAADPCTFRAAGDRITIVALEIPKALLAMSPARARRAMERPVSGREGIGALLAQTLLRLASDTTAYPVPDALRLGMVVADLVTAMFAHALRADDPSLVRTPRRILLDRIHAYIHDRLPDPDLTPRTIAAAHHISARHLYCLFRDEDDSVAAHVRRARLEHARRDLEDPTQERTPVYVIAARWGFPQHAVFTRTFRTTYGIPPTEHRHHTIHGDASARSPEGRTRERRRERSGRER
ncbi:helix-turn-helix domain-containing protein [Embleya sp. NPDC056575]|uniref:helix-turn-helix domain-containing protein n=1 Tax=unclassified Embleya TaxID=2699296 RepID=UPI0036918CF8